MKTLTQTILFAAAIMTTGVAGAGVYKYIDENGKVAYGDKPVEGSEKVTIRNDRSSPEPSPQFEDEEEGEEEYSQSVETRSSSRNEAQSEEGRKSVVYQRLEILTPRQGKVINNRAGSVQIIFLPTPALDKNDVLVISVDGKDISKGRDANLSLQNMQRGDHKVTGRILDQDGVVKIQSDSVSFQVKSPS